MTQKSWSQRPPTGKSPKERATAAENEATVRSHTERKGKIQNRGPLEPIAPPCPSGCPTLEVGACAGAPCLCDAPPPSREVRRHVHFDEPPANSQCSIDDVLSTILDLRASYERRLADARDRCYAARGFQSYGRRR